jgi:hypothetical protein
MGKTDMNESHFVSPEEYFSLPIEKRLQLIREERSRQFKLREDCVTFMPNWVPEEDLNKVGSYRDKYKALGFTDEDIRKDIEFQKRLLTKRIGIES